MDLLNSLNQRQREAVSAENSNIVVLAGAGSGKTLLLVHRFAWLHQVEGLSPYSILAVTFTNKAATELRHRIENLIGPARGMWIGTFHGLAHRLLRAHWHDARLPENFQILDTDDQLRLVRRVLRALNLNEEQWQPKQTQWFINAKKDEGLRPQQVQCNDFHTKKLVEIYQAYEQACAQAGVVDFAELLLRAQELWLHNPTLLEHYQQRFRHILVDEFQDTNSIQYSWIRLLTTKDNYLMVVGDDDQSIYGWRGAKMENIHKVMQDFPGMRIIRLEQNYRSTATILNAANALIQHNNERLGKTLWTSGEEGEPIVLYAAFNELDEARYIVDSIRQYINTGYSHGEIAILYRSNAQSRVLEEALIQAAMPYRIYGGLRFFERAEIKDGLAYLRLLINRHDDTAFERVVNTPTRGIGTTTINTLRELVREHSISLWRAAEITLEQNLLPNRALNALQHFLALIDEISAATVTFEPGELTQYALQASGLYDHYRKEKGEKGQTRIENLDELVTAARVFRPENNDMPLLQAFLSHTALEAGDNQANAFEDSVQLMTLHSAKGLEFPIVFISGMEEGLFPHYMSADAPGRLEEERRLCYVGITRAMRQLHLTYAEIRRLHGSENYHRPSRFISEIPANFINEVRLKAKISRPLSTSSIISSFDQSESSMYRMGSRVSHGKFGEGFIVACEGNGPNARLQVNFPSVGSKWLLASYVSKLE
jgi:DNA helicase-2/ATP-dependent DNA helicase PcrA